MWISGYDPCCGPRVPAHFDPPYPIQLPPAEVLPVLLKHGFMRWLPDGLLPWLIVTVVLVLLGAGLSMLTLRMVHLDRTLSGD